MATLATPGGHTTRFKVLVCVLVASAGLVVGRLSRDQPVPDITNTSRRALASGERGLIVATIAQTLADATTATIAWQPLILTNREGVSDYCATIRERDRDIGFYAQLIFPHADPHEKLSRVNFAIIAVADNLGARYLVSVACARYGYAVSVPANP